MVEEHLTDLVLREFGLSPSSYESYVICSPEHLRCSNSSIEI